MSNVKLSGGNYTITFFDKNLKRYEVTEGDGCLRYLKLLNIFTKEKKLSLHFNTLNNEERDQYFRAINILDDILEKNSKRNNENNESDKKEIPDEKYESLERKITQLEHQCEDLRKMIMDLQMEDFHDSFKYIYSKHKQKTLH